MSLILANCSTEEKPPWFQIIGMFRFHRTPMVLKCQNWSSWIVHSQEIPVLLTGRAYDQVFLFIYYLEPFRKWILLISWIEHWRRILLKMWEGNRNWFFRTFHSWWSLKARVIMSCQVLPNLWFFFFFS